MKKAVILFIALNFNVLLYGITEADIFFSGDKFKNTEFFYPVITINGELGQRFAYEPIDNLLEDDYQTVDSYTFNNGYLKLSQQFTKNAKVNIKYIFSKKEYDITKNLNNKSWTYRLSVLYKLLPDLTADIGLSYKEKIFNYVSDKNNYITSPGVELKFKPRKEVLFGLKYVYGNNKFQNSSNDSKNNRILLYWQERFYNGKLKLRVRYRGENRDYIYPDNIHKNSMKHSVSATAKIDFN